MRRASRLWLLIVCALGGCAGSNDEVSLHERLDFDRALTGSIYEVLSVPDRLELLTLSPRIDQGDSAEVFHGAAVLGRAPIFEEPIQRALVSAFYRDAKNAAGYFGCFDSLYGLQAVRDGAVVDIVFAFHCGQYMLYDGRTRPTGLVRGAALDMFDRVAREHELPVEDEAIGLRPPTLHR